MAQSMIHISNLSKTFTTLKGEVQVLRNIDFDIKKGEFVTMVGYSGCGKSTLLKIIGGLVDYEQGTVMRNGTTVTGPGQDCGIVFQDHRLLPWLKVKENVGFGLRMKSKKEKIERVNQHLQLVGLEGYGNHYPHQLSGGMSQRAAIARGLVNNPPLLLLDEPFGALDALTKIKMQKEIKRIQQEEGTTMLMVTHDIDEAIVLGDRVVVMTANPGEVKDVFSITEAAHRRNSEEFNRYKKKIYQDLFEEEEEFEVEYYI